MDSYIYIFFFFDNHKTFKGNEATTLKKRLDRIYKVKTKFLERKLSIHIK